MSVSLAGLLALAGLAPAAPALAAGGDNVGAATGVGVSLTNDTTSNAAATRDAGETGTCGAFPSAQPAVNTRSLWYKYSAAANGWLSADTRNSTYDTVLEVYTSSVGAPTAGQLISLACNDDINLKSVRQSAVQVPVSAGTTYYLAIRSWGTSEAVGTASFSASFSTKQQLYVALTGDDANLGTSDAPFLTIPHALSAASPAGDGVINFLDAGPYPAASITRTVQLVGVNTTVPAATLANNAQIMTGTTGFSATTSVTVTAGSRAQDGVLLAGAGATVNLLAGTYTETVAISRSVTLRGPAAGARAVIKPAGGDGVQITAGAGVTLANLDVQNAANGVLVTGGSSVVVTGTNFLTNTTALSATVPVTAVRNWWGSANGPFHANNPGGDGQPVSDNVTYSPWCSTAAPTCDPVRGPLAALAFKVQPASAAATVAIAPAVVVEARDAFSNVIANYTGTLTVTLGANPGGSTLSGTTAQPAAAGVVTYTNLSLDNPGAGYTLIATTAKPGGGVITATSAAFNIFNTPPVAVNDTATVLEDKVITVTVLANDSDPNNDQIHIVSLITSSNASLVTSTLSVSDVVYTPAANFFGTDYFTYTINDLYGSGIATATVMVTVTAVNDPPTMVLSPTVTVNEDSPLYTVTEVTSYTAGPANETGQLVTFTVTNTNPSLFSSQPVISSSGVLTFTPTTNAYGTALVYVTATDNGGTLNGGQDTSAASTFLLTVTPVNDQPSFSLSTTALTLTADSGFTQTLGFATAISAGINETQQTTWFTTNFTTNSPFPAPFVIPPTIDSPTGTLTFQAAQYVYGVFTVTALLHDNGTTNNGGIDTSAPLTFTINITAVPHPPVAVADITSTLEDTAVLTFNVLANDADPDLQPITVTAVGLTAAGLTSFTANSVAFTPTTDYNGTAVFTYTISDPGALTATATVTVTVTPVNDPPQFTLTVTNTTILEDSGVITPTVAGAIRAGPLTAVDEITTTPQALTFTVATAYPLSFTVAPALDPAGVLTLRPAQDVFGVFPLTITLQDSGSGVLPDRNTSAGQVFTLTITPVNDPPSFTPGADQTVNEDAGPQSVAGWATSISAGLYEITQTVTFNVVNTNTTLFTAQPAVNSAGTLTYQSAVDANGQAWVYVSARDNGGTASGGNAQSVTRTFTITIQPVNDPPTYTLAAGPTVSEDSVPFSQNSFLTNLAPGPVTASDEVTQTVAVSVTNSTPAAFSAQPALTVAGNQAALTFTPAPNANGVVTVTVSAQDNAGGQDTTTQTFTITITPVPDAPLAFGDTLTVTEDSAAAVLGVLANDTSVDHPQDQSTLSVLSFTPATSGTLALAAPQLTYTPAANYFGPDAFRYVLTDSASGLTATAAVTLDVLPVNDPPSFTKGVDITRAEDSPAVTFLNWATSISPGPANEAGQIVTFSVTSTVPAMFAVQPSVNAADGGLSFTPAPNAFGTATVWVTAHDDGGRAYGGLDASGPQTFTLTLTPVNDPPTAVNDTFTVLVDSVNNVLNVMANDSDAPDTGETLSVIAVSPALSGTVSVAPDHLSALYTPPAGFRGTDTFTYTLSDGTGLTAVAAVTVNVGAPASRLYLPALTRSYAPLPDLVGSFSLNPAQPAAGQPVLITAVITNQGGAVSGGFWVDFYVNPNPPPDAANQPWDRRCGLTPCVGLAWYVPGPLASGQSVTLTSAANSYYGRNTVWTGALPAGASALYLYVDSWNCDPTTSVCVAEGAVPESDETNNRFARVGFGPLEAPAEAFSLDLPLRPAALIPSGE